MALDPLLTNEIIELPSDDDYEEEQPNGNVATHLGFNPQLGRDQINYDAQLDYDRRRKRDKLKDRFEHIFAKYGKDFDGIGDEIDLENGIIVVDNGHLRGMAHEVDAGDEDVAEKPDQQDERLDETQAESEEGAGNDDSDWNELENGPWAGYEESASGSTTPAPPENILDQLPSLRDSVLALQIQQKQEGGIDQNAIDALGMSIAKQLADLMGQPDNPKPKRKRHADPEDRWAYPDIPQPAPEKRRRRSLSPLPDLAGPSPGRKSLWAPLRVPKERKRKATTQDAVQAEEVIVPAVKPEDANIIPNEQLPRDLTTRKCYHCGSTNSNVWRRGPDGAMCNACGMYHYRYGLLRPVGPQLEVDESSSSSDSSDSDSDTDDVESLYSANTSRRRDELPTRKHDRFHPAEDVLILKLKEIDRMSWERIAKHLPARTAYAVQCRYSKKMHKQPIEARATLANQGYEFTHDENGLIVFTPAPLPVAFTDEEDELLLRLREEEKLDWEIVAASFPDRTPKALEQRFNQIVKTIMRGLKHPNRIGSARKSKNKIYTRYSEEEDQLLKKLREVDKLRWSELAERFPGRNSMGLQKRYTRGILEATKRPQAPGKGTAVDSTEDEDRLGHTSPEDVLILRLRDEEGLNWAEIEQRLPVQQQESVQYRYEYITAQREHAEIVEDKATAERANHLLRANEHGAQSADELLNDELEEYHPMPTTIGSGLHTAALGNAVRTTDVPFEKAQSVTPSIAAADVDARDSSTHSRLQSELQPPEGLIESTKPTSLSSVPGSKPLARWSKEEDVVLKQLHQNGVSWKQMSSHLPGRSARAIQCHWNTLSSKHAQRHSSSEAQVSSSRSLLRRAMDNNTRQQSTSAEAFFSGRPPVTIVDLTDEEDHLVLETSDMRRPPIPSPRSRGSLPPIALTRESVAPEEEVMEQRTKIPPSVFAPPKRAASKAALSPVRPPVVSAAEGIWRQRSVLDGLPKVPAVFRSDGASMLPPAVNARNSTGVVDQKQEQRAERIQDLSTVEMLELEHSIHATHAAIIHPPQEAIDDLPQQSFDVDPRTGIASAENSRPATREGPQPDTEYPETPLLGLQSSPPSAGMSSVPYESYATPARFNEQNHPYFIAPPVFTSSSAQQKQHTTPVLTTEEERNAGDRRFDTAGEEAIVPQRRTRRKLQPVKKREQPIRRIAQRVPGSSGNAFDIPLSEANPSVPDTDAPVEQEISLQATCENPIITQSQLMVDGGPPVMRQTSGRPGKTVSELQEASQTGVEANSIESSATLGVGHEEEPASPEPNARVAIETTQTETSFYAQRPRRKGGRPRRFLHHATAPLDIKPRIAEPENMEQDVAGTDTQQLHLNDDADAQIKRDLVEAMGLPDSHSEVDVQLTTSLDVDADELSQPMLLMSEPSTGSSLPVDPGQLSRREADIHGTPFSTSRDKTSSDINREPDSTPSPPRTRSQARLASLASSPIDPSTTDSNIIRILPSSSPLPPVKKTLKSVYTRTSTTPGTDRSTLFGRPEHGRVHALRSSFGRSSPVVREYRSSSVGLPGSRKRIVHTPMRDREGSEDELA